MSSPPTNHLANGAPLQSRVCSKSLAQVIRERAWSAQKPSWIRRGRGIHLRGPVGRGGRLRAWGEVHLVDVAGQVDGHVGAPRRWVAVGVPSQPPRCPPQRMRSEYAAQRATGCAERTQRSDGSINDPGQSVSTFATGGREMLDALTMGRRIGRREPDHHGFCVQRKHRGSCGGRTTREVGVMFDEGQLYAAVTQDADGQVRVHLGADHPGPERPGIPGPARTDRRSRAGAHTPARRRRSSTTRPRSTASGHWS